jgi:hypothetical protein
MTDTIQAYHISLGLDCSVAYQLKKFGLRTYAFPLDWVKIKSLDSLQLIIQDNFSNLLKKNWSTFEQSDKYFALQDSDKKSLIGIRCNETNVIIPHESIQHEIDINEVHVNLQRRVQRFQDIMQSRHFKYIYIGFDTKDAEKSIKSIKNIQSILETYYVAETFQIVPINYSLYTCTDQDFSWHRNYIDWSAIFRTHV